MELTVRETWTVLHGMVFGAIYLLAFGGGLAGLYSLRPELVTGAGIHERMKRMKLGLWVMTVIAWATVITGTWVVYVWYRATPPPGASLAHFPRSFLLSNPRTADWHEFGMEWKEHVAWLCPILATSTAFTVHVYGERLANHPSIRKALIAALILAFAASAVAGVFGAFINKVAATI
jgi:hypothetical protein